MNEELQKALAEFVKQMVGLVEKGSAMGAEQLPLVLQDIVGAAILQATTFGVVSVVVIALAVVWIIVDRVTDSFDGLGQVLGSIIALASSGTLAFAIYNYLYATHFPRLVILDYLRGLL